MASDLLFTPSLHIAGERYRPPDEVIRDQLINIKGKSYDSKIQRLYSVIKLKKRKDRDWEIWDYTQQALDSFGRDRRRRRRHITRGQQEFLNLIHRTRTQPQVGIYVTNRTIRRKRNRRRRFGDCTPRFVH